MVKMTDEEILDFASKDKKENNKTNTQVEFETEEDLFNFVNHEGRFEKSSNAEDMENVKRASILNSSADGTSPADGFKKSIEGSPKEAVNRGVEKFVRSQQSFLNDVVGTQLENTTDPEEKKGIIQEGKEIRESLKNLENSPGAEREAFFQAISGKPIGDMSVEERDKFNKVFEAAAWKDIAALTSEKSALDKTMSFVGTFVPFTATEDYEDLTNEIFGAAEAGKEIVNNFNALPANEKAELWPWLRDKAFNEMNDIRAASFMKNLLRPGGAEIQESETTTEQIFDAFDASTLGAGFLGKLAESRQLTNAVKAAEHSSNPDLAGELNAASLFDEETGRVADVSKPQAANNAQPLDHSNWNSAHTPNVAPGTTENIENFQQRLNKTIQDVLDRRSVLIESVLDEHQKKTVVPKIQDRIEQNVTADLKNLFGDQIQDIQYKTDETGVTLEATINHPNNDIAKASLPLEDLGRMGVEVERTDIPDIMRSDGDFFSSRKGAQAAINSQKRPELSKDTHEPVEMFDGEWVIRPKTGGTTTLKKRVRFTLDEREAFTGSERIGAVNRALGNPTSFPGELFKSAFRSRTRAENTSARLADQLFKMEKEALKPISGKTGKINKRSQERLEKALFHFDEYVDEATGKMGREPTDEELKGGIMVDDSRGLETEIVLTDKEIEAYRNLRKLYDGLYALENEAVKRAAEAKGLKRVAMGDSENLGKVIESPESARGTIQGENLKRVMARDVNGEEVDAINVNQIKVEDWYNEGYKMVRFEETAQNPKTGEFFQTAFVRDEDITELPPKVLNYRDGYVPKINQDDVWIVQMNKRGTVDGKENVHANTHTLALANNRQAADNMVEHFKQSAGEGEDIKAVQGTEVNDVLDPRARAIGSGAGLFTKPRAKHDIFFNRINRKPERMGVMEATQRNIQHVSNYVPLAELRLGYQDSWVKTFNNIYDESDHIKDFPNNPTEVLPETQSKEARSLMRMHEQIMDWNMVPHKHEQMWQGAVQNTFEWALGKGLVKDDGTVASITRGLRSKDPAAQMRSISFHTMLGMGNPIQLIVQAQNSVAALAVEGLSANPLRAADAVRSWSGLRAGILTENPKTIDNIASSVGMDKQRFREMLDAFKRSGLVEGIRTNPDLQVAAQGGPTGVGAIRRTLDAGLIPFREGEIVSRGVAFSAAFNRFKRANPKKVINESDIKNIVDDANRFMLNMGRSNRARWQRGLWSIPTQFLQVQSKIIQNMNPKILGGSEEFSGTEKAKLFLAQASLYGAAGVPAGEWLIGRAYEQAGLSTEWAQNNPVKIKQINQGLWGSLFLHSLGLENFQVANRLSVTDGVEQMVGELLTGEMSFPEAMFGAFGSVPLRAFRELSKLETITMAASERGSFTSTQLLTAARAIGRISSTWNQADRAIFQMHMMNQITDRSGVNVVSRDFDFQEELAAGLGLKPQEISKAQDYWIKDKTRQDHIRKVADTAMQTMTNHIESMQVGGVKEQEKDLTKLIMQTLIQGYSPEFQREVKSRVRDRLRKRDKLDQRQRRVLDQLISDNTDNAFELIDLLKSNAVNVPEKPEELEGSALEEEQEAAKMNEISEKTLQLINGEILVEDEE